MSSKRGRKRNDNLPPNRARDVQRAFRARRAAHLQAMEERVAELEEENDRLRAALNLPPANRPPLGKGPTGKDKPKSYVSSPIDASGSGSSSQTMTGCERPGPSRATSSAEDSAPPTRGNSLSPSAPPPALRTSPSSWDAMVAASSAENGTESHASPASTAFSHPSPATSSFAHIPPPMSPASFAHGSAGPSTASSQPYTPTGQYSLPPIGGSSLPPSSQAGYSYSAPAPSSSRQAHAGNAYLLSSNQHVPPAAADRQIAQASYGSSTSSYMLRDVRDDGYNPYSYASPGGPPPHELKPLPPSASDTPSSSSSLHNAGVHHHHHPQHAHHRAPRDPPPSGAMPYAPRRSITEPSGFRSLGTHFPHLPHPQAQLVSHGAGVRLPTPPRPPES
ncbi:hypothetical protein PUNSTDRAFT_146885 [Punctularia strigosozonata HHB-11173 SS5]|uniref:BZIP domain-containing protein n=1 Tax=Punctularia strigosozonata (strain HHB-11173) TaxID=741275 RepID=R7S011_PUNST|nr:uncharacterized protein PUNSTDRAFT_146885 [Punctularia strigosozonata HHB-11173 SS5]EIN03705.1 hypothetical protein PUNSTDRAFT_146885 [Punctularia strigosozonata HHB-11173 SS5]